MFDVLNRRMMNVLQRPLLIMDVTLKDYMKLSPKEALSACEELMDEVRSHAGEFLVLWHNSSLDGEGWAGYEEVLIQLMTNE